MTVAGDYFEACAWMFDGGPTREVAERMIQFAFREAEAMTGWKFGELEYEEMGALDAGVPAPPRAAWGRNPVLLYGQAKALYPMPMPQESSILHDLEPRDLAHLRTATRRAFERVHPDAPELTDEECDEIIDTAAPGIIERMIVEGARDRTRH